VLDDVFSVAGLANGTVKRHDKHSNAQPESPNHLPGGSTAAGLLRLISNSGKTNAGVTVLDYGSDICDNKAALTVNGTPHEITLY